MIAAVSAIAVAVIQKAPWDKNEAIIAGQVRGAGRPIPHARIDFVGRPESGTTEDNGNFSIKTRACPKESAHAGDGRRDLTAR